MPASPIRQTQQHFGLWLDEATVKSVQDNQQILVESSAGVCSAHIAASCLLQPEAGDTVLLSQGGRDHYVLAVLKKANSNHTINVQGHLAIRTTGPLSLNTEQHLALMAGERITESAPHLTQISNQQTTTNQEWHINNNRLRLLSKRITAQAEHLDSVIERCYHKAQQVIRRVEGLEVVNIGSWIQSVRQVLNSRARYTQITAQEDVQVDAKRIHMG